MTDDLRKAWDHADANPPDQTEAEDVDEAVFIGRQLTGNTIAVGREDKDEWIIVEDMEPIDVST